MPIASNVAGTIRTRFKPAAKALIIIQSSIPEQLKRVYFDILLTLFLDSGDRSSPLALTQPIHTLESQIDATFGQQTWQYPVVNVIQ